MAVLSKPLTASDCRYKFDVPKDFHHLINGCCGGAELSVRDADTNKMYMFVLAVREPPYQKPVFQAAGWLDFVRSRHLKAGDIIFFSKDEKNAGGFRIEAHCYFEVTDPHYAFEVTEPLSKRLTPPDCNSAFSVTTDFLALIKGLRPRGAELSVRDVQTNQVYNFVLKFLREMDNPWPKPVFQAEAWLDFVNTTGLEAGDEIYFSTDETNAGAFTIRPFFDFLGRSDRAAASTSMT